MPKRGLPFKKEDFFFNDRDKRLFVVALRVVALAAAVCLVVLVVVAIARGASRQEGAARPSATETSPPSAAETAAPAGTGEGTAAVDESGKLTERMSLSSFVIPDEAERLFEPEHAPLRQRMGAWDRKMIDRFWVPPMKIGLENLKKLNDKNIEDMFEGVQ
jgi:hypothetical protein